MNKFVNTLLYALWIIAGLIFIGSILYAGYATLWVKSTESMPVFLSWAATVVGGALATNFGAVLGISVSPQTDKFNSVSMFRPLRSGSIPKDNREETSMERMQITVAYTYFIGMCVAFILFAFNGFAEKAAETVVLLPELSRSLIGAAVGALGVAKGT